MIGVFYGVLMLLKSVFSFPLNCGNREILRYTVQLPKTESALKLPSSKLLFFVSIAFNLRLDLMTPFYLLVLGSCSKRLILTQWKTGLYPEDLLYTIASVKLRIKLPQILIKYITSFLIWGLLHLLLNGYRVDVQISWCLTLSLRRKDINTAAWYSRGWPTSLNLATLSD